MKKNIALLVTIITIAQSSLAGNLVERIKKENPKLTAFQVLEKAFNSASDLISMNDFATNIEIRNHGAKPWQIVYPELEKDSNIYNTKTAAVAVFQWTIPGADAKGPLFPKQSDTVIKRLLMCRDRYQNQSIKDVQLGGCDEDREYALARSTQPLLFNEGHEERIDPRQLSITSKYNSSSFNTTTYRKSGDLIFIRVDDFDGKKKTVKYTYGWKQQSN